MVFAHGPGSFLTAYATKKVWSKDVSPSFQRKLLVLAAILGAAVDLDMLFVWFLDGRNSHREFVTHTPLLYAVLTLLILGFGFLRKSKKIAAVGKVFFIATITHIILDSLFGGIMWLFPFSDDFFGLMLFDVIADSFYGVHSLFINYTLEALFFALSGLVALNVYLQSKTRLIRFVQGSLIVGWGVFALLFFTFSFNAYRIGGNMHLTDIDGDGILNTKDFDMDGDGIENIYDRDAAGDGMSNAEKNSKALERMSNVSFTPDDGVVYEFAGRLGFFNEKDVIEKAYAHAGISMKQELIRSFNESPEGYSGVPTDNDFDVKIENYYTFFEKNAYIVGTLDNLEDTQVGDVWFVVEKRPKGEKVVNAAMVLEPGVDEAVLVFVPEMRGEYYTSNKMSDKIFFSNLKFDHDFEYPYEVHVARLKYQN